MLVEEQWPLMYIDSLLMSLCGLQTEDVGRACSLQPLHYRSSPAAAAAFSDPGNKPCWKTGSTSCERMPINVVRVLLLLSNQ